MLTASSKTLEAWANHCWLIHIICLLERNLMVLDHTSMDVSMILEFTQEPLIQQKYQAFIMRMVGDAISAAFIIFWMGWIFNESLVWMNCSGLQSKRYIGPSSITLGMDGRFAFITNKLKYIQMSVFFKQLHAIYWSDTRALELLMLMSDSKIHLFFADGWTKLPIDRAGGSVRLLIRGVHGINPPIRLFFIPVTGPIRKQF